MDTKVLTQQLGSSSPRDNHDSGYKGETSAVDSIQAQDKDGAGLRDSSAAVTRMRQTAVITLTATEPRVGNGSTSSDIAVNPRVLQLHSEDSPKPQPSKKRKRAPLLIKEQPREAQSKAEDPGGSSRSANGRITRSQLKPSDEQNPELPAIKGASSSPDAAFSPPTEKSRSAPTPSAAASTSAPQRRTTRGGGARPPTVSMSARTKDRKTSATPFVPRERPVELRPDMSEGERAAATARNNAVAAERKDNERRRNNQSAKRARIRKMALAVALSDEIARLRGRLVVVEGDGAAWRLRALREPEARGFAYVPCPGAAREHGADQPPPVPPVDGGARGGGDVEQMGRWLARLELDGYHESEVEDMRRCLRAYLESGELVAQCTQDFHDEIAAVMARGDEIRRILAAQMPPEGEEGAENSDDVQMEVAVPEMANDVGAGAGAELASVAVGEDAFSAGGDALE